MITLLNLFSEKKRISDDSKKYERVAEWGVVGETVTSTLFLLFQQVEMTTDPLYEMSAARDVA